MLFKIYTIEKGDLVDKVLLFYRMEIEPQKKRSNAAGADDAISMHLLKDWTDTFVYILEKLIFDMTNHYNDSQQLRTWKRQISYF